jgi:hypothetical protein
VSQKSPVLLNQDRFVKAAISTSFTNHSRTT